MTLSFFFHKSYKTNPFYKVSTEDLTLIMITIISGTNRNNSKTEVVSKTYLELFKKNTEEQVNYISMQDLPDDLLHNAMYSPDGQSKALAKIQDDFIIPAGKYFIVSPEYNGGIPGVLKLFLDAISIREYGATFKTKKVGLAGVASGRAGNLRGLDQLTSIFNHTGSVVLPNKLPLSNIGALTDDHTVTDEATLDTMEKQVQEFINF